MNYLFCQLSILFLPISGILGGVIAPESLQKIQGDVVWRDGTLTLNQHAQSPKAKAEIGNITNAGGKKYRLQYEIQGTGGSSDQTGFQFYRIRMTWIANQTECRTINGEWQDTMNGQWQKRWFDFTAPSQESTLRLTVELRGNGGIAIRNAQVTERTEAPRIVRPLPARQTLPPAPTEVSIGNDKILRINGEPFFPIAVWSLKKEPYWDESAADTALLREAAAHGINTLITRFRSAEHARQVLGLAERNGMKVILMPNSHKNPPLTPGAQNRWRRELAALLPPDVRAHRALLCYMIADEPLWNGKPLEGIIELYQILKEFDPYRPIWINMAPRNSVADLAAYAEAADLFGADIYPWPEGNSHSGLDDKSLLCVGKYTERMTEAVNGRKPVWMLLQGFAWGDLTGATPDYPPLDALRFMTCQVLVRNGTPLFWGTHYVRDDKFRDTLYQMTSELRDLAPILRAETVNPSPVSVTPETVRVLHKRDGRNEWLLAVNESADSVNAQFRYRGKTIHRVFPPRSSCLINLNQ